MFIIKYTKIWYTLSILLITASFLAMYQYGFNLSIDFKGGTITEASYVGGRPEKDMIESSIASLELGGFSVRPSGEENYVIRTRELTLEEQQALAEAIGNPLVERQNTIGPVAGVELQGKALKAIIVVVLMIVLFITFAFRRVSTAEDRARGLPSSWKYGLATIVALAHDVVIPTGIFIFLGHTLGFEIDLLFVTGLLAILGYSVHDTIVVFDRVRENLSLNKGKEFETTVGKSINQTFARSINTSITIFITLLALYIFGSSATKSFSLLLIIGLIAGTYSSIFIASPLLVTFFKLQRKGVQ